MKSPDEIKKSLAFCVLSFCPPDCPYRDECYDGSSKFQIDTLEYIKQLEAERDAAVEAIEHTCATCKHYYYNSTDGSDCKYDCLEGSDGCHNGNTRWEWCGIQKEDCKE